MKADKNTPEWVGAVGFCDVCRMHLTLEITDHPTSSHLSNVLPGSDGPIRVWVARCSLCGNRVYFYHRTGDQT